MPLLAVADHVRISWLLKHLQASHDRLKFTVSFKSVGGGTSEWLFKRCFRQGWPSRWRVQTRQRSSVDGTVIQVALNKHHVDSDYFHRQIPVRSTGSRGGAGPSTSTHDLPACVRGPVAA